MNRKPEQALTFQQQLKLNFSLELIKDSYKLKILFYQIVETEKYYAQALPPLTRIASLQEEPYMQDQDKTKDHLIDELNEMHHRVAELETAQATLFIGGML